MHTICIFKGRRAGTDDHLRDDGWQYSLWITSLSISSCSNFHARTWIVKVVVAHKVIHVVCNTDSSLCWGHIQRWKVSWWIGCLMIWVRILVFTELWNEWCHGVLPAYKTHFYLQLSAQTNVTAIKGKSQTPSFVTKCLFLLSVQSLNMRAFFLTF